MFWGARALYFCCHWKKKWEQYEELEILEPGYQISRIPVTDFVRKVLSLPILQMASLRPTEIKTLAPLCSNLQTWGFGLFDSTDWALFPATPRCLPTWMTRESRPNRQPWDPRLKCTGRERQQRKVGKEVGLRSQCSPPGSNVRINSHHSFTDLIQQIYQATAGWVPGAVLGAGIRQ